MMIIWWYGISVALLKIRGIHYNDFGDYSFDIWPFRFDDVRAISDGGLFGGRNPHFILFVYIVAMTIRYVFYIRWSREIRWPSVFGLFGGGGGGGYKLFIDIICRYLYCWQFLIDSIHSFYSDIFYSVKKSIHSYSETLIFYHSDSHSTLIIFWWYCVLLLFYSWSSRYSDTVGELTMTYWHSYWYWRWKKKKKKNSSFLLLLVFLLFNSQSYLKKKTILISIVFY